MDLYRKTVDEFAALGGTQVGLTPVVGEPLVDRWVFDRLDYVARKREIRVCHLFTNAIALSPEVADRLLCFGDKLTVNVSLAGLDARTYAAATGVDRFDAVVSNLEHLVARQEAVGSNLDLTISVRTPRAGLAGPVLEGFLRHQMAGRLRLTWLPEYDSWGGAVSPEALASIGLEMRVPAARRGLCYWLLKAPAVLADGRVNACACRDAEAELVVGDLREEPLAGILAGSSFREIVRRQELGDFPDVCARCTLYSPVSLRWMLETDYPNERPLPLDGRDSIVRP